MNWGNSKTFGPHKLVLNLADKLDLKRNDMLHYQILVSTIPGKTKKSHKGKT